MENNVVATPGLMDRPGRTIWRSPVRHAAAFLVVAGAVTILEMRMPDFDHGTHLLVVLTLVLGIALLFGPRPAMTGFVIGGVLAGIATILTVEGALGTPHAYVQLSAYLLAGGALIVLATAAGRSRQRSSARATAAPIAAGEHADLAEPLTGREVEVLRLAATGLPVEEIARRMYVSPNTVKTHLAHVYGKLGVHGRSEAVRAALHAGCLSPSDICPHLAPGEAGESPNRVMPEHLHG